MLWLNGKNLFDQRINTNNKTFQNIRKIATGQWYDYANGCLLDYRYLSKQQTLDSDLRAIEQINFTSNLDRAGNRTLFFIIEETKETVLELSQGTSKVL